MEHASRIGGVRLVWADLPTHCKVTMGIGGVPLWNVFSTEIVESVFTLAAEFMLPDGTVVVACRVEHLFVVTHEARELQFRHLRTIFLRMPALTYAIVDDFTDPVTC